MEKSAFKINGFVILILVLALIGAAVYCFIATPALTAWGVTACVIAVILCCGLVVVFPIKVAVLTFFGKYTGTVKDTGIWFVIPFSIAKKSFG